MAGILAVVQAAALVGFELAIAPRTPVTELGTRHAALRLFPTGWILSWGVWMLAGFAFLGVFLFVLWEVGSTRVTRTATWLAGASCVLAMGSRVLLCGGLPLVARMETAARFEVFERAVRMVDLTPTRVLQAAAVLVLTLGLTRVRAGAGLPRGVRVLAWVYAAAALALAAAGVLALPALAAGAVVPEGIALALWALTLARALA